MSNIKFESGLKTFTINEAIEVSFNATDGTFVERIYKVFDTMDKKQEDYGKRAKKDADPREVFELMRERDKEARELIDGLFNAPVCEAVFGRMNVFALADGLPVWANLLLAVMEEIDSAVAREKKATDATVKKYTNKWKR